MRPQARMLRPRLNTSIGRSASGTRHSTGMYFTEVDVTAKGAGDFKYDTVLKVTYYIERNMKITYFLFIYYIQL